MIYIYIYIYNKNLVKISFWKKLCQFFRYLENILKLEKESSLFPTKLLSLASGQKLFVKVENVAGKTTSLRLKSCLANLNFFYKTRLKFLPQNHLKSFFYIYFHKTWCYVVQHTVTAQFLLTDPRVLLLVSAIKYRK